MRQEVYGPAATPVVHRKHAAVCKTRCRNSCCRRRKHLLCWHVSAPAVKREKVICIFSSLGGLYQMDSRSNHKCTQPQCDAWKRVFCHFFLFSLQTEMQSPLLHTLRTGCRNLQELYNGAYQPFSSTLLNCLVTTLYFEEVNFLHAAWKSILKSCPHTALGKNYILNMHFFFNLWVQGKRNGFKLEDSHVTTSVIFSQRCKWETFWLSLFSSLSFPFSKKNQKPTIMKRLSDSLVWLAPTSGVK